jgi:N-acetylneuraminic acid mutarotase
VFGGTDGEVDGFSTVEAYDPATDTWTTRPLAQMPVDEVVSFNGVGKIGNRLYLPGGNVETGNGNLRLRTLQVYDPARNTWTRKADMPRGSSDGVSGVIDGKLYVLTAVETFDEECPDCIPSTRATRRLFRYDPATDTWTKLAWCPNFHHRGMAGVVDGKFYVAGGIGSNKLDIYNPVTNRWSSGAPMPNVRSGAGAAVITGKLFVIGGFSDAGITDEVLAYDRVRNQWITKAALPAPRGSLAAAKIVIAGRPHIVAVGGTGEPFTVLSETDVYSP